MGRAGLFEARAIDRAAEGRRAGRRRRHKRAGDPNELAEDEDAMALRPKLGEDLVDQHHLRQSQRQ